MGTFATEGAVAFMCGILAVFSKKNKLDIDFCDQALLLMKRRGPDWQQSTFHMNGRLYLGQTVLSITGNGRQPELADDHYQVLFNGEIYNHVNLYNDFLRPRGFSWVSNTDTEILTKLHHFLSEVEVYKRLSGMFAYVVYDHAKARLLIGRDPVGEKPLYYYEDESMLIFCSEIGPILRLVPGIKMDREILREYFFTRHLLIAEQTVWKGVQIIMPGQLREYDLRGQRYSAILHMQSLPSFINPQRAEENKKASPEALIEELNSVCRKAAADLCPKLNYASVVSGGVDSSLASWFMSTNEDKPSLVALQFPGKDQPSSDESLIDFEKTMPWAIKTNKVSEEQYRERLDICYQVACAPLPTHSYVSQAILAEAVRDLGLRVLILGEGADELFGGYETYRFFRHYPEISQAPSENLSVYSGFSACRVRFEGWQPERLRARQADQWRFALECYGHETSPLDQMIQAMLLLDVTVQLPSVGIQSADQMSMAYGVEARSFYLHESVMRFALNLPIKYKLDWDALDRRFVTKSLLKHVFASKFGAGLIRRKNGFSGWPNEAGRVLTDGDYSIVREVLGSFTINFITQRQWRAAEWKMQNMSMFLKRFADYA